MKTAHDLVVAARARIVEISAEEAKVALAGTDVLIDVREPDEFAAGHLPGAVNIPRGLLEFRLSATESLQRRDLNVIVYCKTGGRSALAACAMQDMGYLELRSLAGGFDGWLAAGGDVARPAPLSFE